MGGDSVLQAYDRRDIKAQAVLFQYITEGACFRFLANQKFFDPCGSAAMLDTFGLGAGKNMLYGHRGAGGVAAQEWSTDVWIFLFRPDLFDMMCSVILVGCGWPLWVWTCDSRTIAL